MKNRRLWIVVPAWMALFGAAVAADVPVSRWAHDSGLSDSLKHHWVWLLWTIRRAGDYWTYPLVAGLLLISASRTRDGIFLLIAGALSGLNAPLKWIVGRHRPYHGYGVFELHPCNGSLKGLIGMDAGLSFPSGDAALAAAASVALIMLFPRWRWGLVSVVVLVCLERIAEGAHYPSDTVGGALLGCLAAIWARRLVGLFPAGKKGLENQS